MLKSVVKAVIKDDTESKGPIIRIRRITGYLVGSIDRWNSAKKEELHDRVTHSIK